MFWVSLYYSMFLFILLCLLLRFAMCLGFVLCLPVFPLSVHGVTVSARKSVKFSVLSGPLCLLVFCFILKVFVSCGHVQFTFPLSRQL